MLHLPFFLLFIVIIFIQRNFTPYSIPWHIHFIPTVLNLFRIEIRGPLTNFTSRSQTTTENFAMKNCQNWSVCVFISLQNRKAATTGSRTTSWEPLLYLDSFNAPLLSFYACCIVPASVSASGVHYHSSSSASSSSCSSSSFSSSSSSSWSSSGQWQSVALKSHSSAVCYQLEASHQRMLPSQRSPKTQMSYVYQGRG